MSRWPPVFLNQSVIEVK